MQCSGPRPDRAQTSGSVGLSTEPELMVPGLWQAWRTRSQYIMHLPPGFMWCLKDAGPARCWAHQTCITYTATLSLNRHQIWSQSAESFLSYIAWRPILTPFTRQVIHVRVTPKWAKSGCKQRLLNNPTAQWRPRVNQTHSFVDTSKTPFGRWTSGSE